MPLYTFVYQRQQAIIDGLQTEYNLRQQIRNVLSDATLELRANKDLTQWLDEETRKLLFNEEDYAALVKEINGINSEMNEAEKEYKQDIAGLQDDEWYQQEKLTELYNIKVSELQEELELAQKKLDVAKKEAEYNNRAKERDTQIVMGNRIINVADPEELYELAKEKIQAEDELTNAQKTQSENKTINEMTAKNLEAKEMASAIQNTIDMWEGMSESARYALIDELIPTIEEVNLALSSLSSISADILRNSTDLFRNGVLELPDIPNLGLGADPSQNYLQQIIDFQEQLEIGSIPQKQSEAIADADTRRNYKRAYYKNYAHYTSADLGGEEFEQYWTTSDEKKKASGTLSKQAAEEHADYQAKIDEIEYTIIYEQSGYATPSQEEDLKRLEGARNYKIWSEGYDYEQTSNWGGKTYSDYVQDDYMASINAMVERVNSRDVNNGQFSNSEKEQLKNWETLRNYKIWATDMPYEQTNDWGGQIFKDHPDVKDIMSDMNILEWAANNSDIGWTDKSIAAAQLWETERGYKVTASGMSSDEHTDKFGGLQFTKEQEDYQYALDVVSSMMDETEGIHGDSTYIRNQLEIWEDARNQKLTEMGEELKQTNNWTNKIYTLIEGKAVDKSTIESADTTSTIATGTPQWKPTPSRHYATGTTSALGGLAITDEEAYELKLREIANGQYALLEQGDMIFTADQTKAMWEFSNYLLQDRFEDIGTQAIKNIQYIQSNSGNSSVVYHFNFGDINMTEAITNGNEFLRTLTNSMNSQYPIIKNTKI